MGISMMSKIPTDESSSDDDTKSQSSSRTSSSKVTLQNDNMYNSENILSCFLNMKFGA